MHRPIIAKDVEPSDHREPKSSNLRQETLKHTPLLAYKTGSPLDLP